MGRDFAAAHNVPMPTTPVASLAWDLFCRVIDNHGDLGVCWRLAADLADRGHRVRLWVDDASALAWMALPGGPGAAAVQVHPWRDPLAGEAPGDVVIEAFGCEPPAAFIARMAAAPVPPVWINLEYLSAEDYVERSHGLPSPQWSGPGRGLTKWFYYPGYTAATGGLLRERDLLARRGHLQAPRERAAFLQARLGLALRPGHAPGSTEDLVLLFGYPQPALKDWLSTFAESPAGPTTLLVTPGHSARAVADALDLSTAPPPGGQLEHGALRVHFLPHVSQVDFDRLLWSCDWNLVRGEDSAVRALWAGRPFLWQLYVQADGAHLAKLDAFLRRYLEGAPADLATTLRRAFRAWNDASDAAATPCWSACWTEWRQAWTAWAKDRAGHFAAQPDLVTQLLAFIATHAQPGSAG
ncbi:hypothetical protein CATMQ487_30790 [Sphaerotilus microaerophilus]|uniref:Protein-arginine rhamnosyltransferase n=2 Tax=Sphaerotilus microaerophilus TaxID=2914710 RepID=A0ABN6PPY8_9BURK|nr:hypothetical protein CATMQ487_30790 [Sphaerotilus sp. FB-5]